MRTLLALILIITSVQVQAAPSAYPMGPDPVLTPGSLCDTPESLRHPEQIAYCGRYVDSYMKDTIFISYRKNLGYSLSGDRYDYKVDHFIPLCFGGSNHKDNLWPQHFSISEITDPIEAAGCEKLQKGKISQKEAIQLIMSVKLNLNEAPRALRYLKSLR
jgi:hypothetical protein